MSAQVAGAKGTCVIRGAAGGSGRTAAVRLAREGATVEILDLKDGSEAVKEIQAADGRANSVCDCTDEEQVAGAAKQIEGRHGRVDILVNNAGILAGRKPWYTLTKMIICDGGGYLH